MNILTIIVLVFLTITTVRGFVRGFSRTILSMVFLILAIVLTMVLTPFMSRLISESQHIQEFFTTKSAQFLDLYMRADGTVDLSSVKIAGQSLADTPFQAAAVILNYLLSLSGVRSVVLEKLVAFENGVAATVVTGILVFVIILIVKFIHGRVGKKGAISTVDHVLGGPLGLARGLVVVWIVLGIINILAFMPAMSGVAMQIRESPILIFLNKYNLVMKGLSVLIARALQ